MKKIKPLAFYLPQYHPVPENNEWWGKGFTEWTNVSKAKPLFEGHDQPIYPADLGYYDLRLPEVREQQAQMAKEYGVHGFIYYHYWFGSGKQLLERVANDVLQSGKPDFPFCFCWANETWSGIWHGLSEKILVKQTYPDEQDLIAHFEYLLPFFKDSRYIKVDNKPVFIVYDANHLNEGDPYYITKFRELAKKNGFDDLYFMASNKLPDDIDFQSLGYDGKISNAFHKAWNPHIRKKEYISHSQYYKNRIKGLIGIKKKAQPKVRMQDANAVVNDLQFEDSNVTTYPCILPNWDNTPRSGYNGIILTNNSPELFEQQIEKAIAYLDDKKDYPEQFLIVKSWNEWAEGNILEPDRRYGFAYLNALKKILNKYSQDE
ncbi:glycosyltransferase WbsX family protein [Chryseobacterium culicis]|uniref:glycosyltransferase WbsX family protein n=1 Tax=Chryseobacterium culicis TaxID=680127 RepID=UPI0018736330|nr:glycoside hydrolase family 99-like domain-containing protein [Chryseobacterium culicis]MBE4950145.1 glycoside hydrolase family 99-like domain-containing protein [Chryseobacterium culicis]